MRTTGTMRDGGASGMERTVTGPDGHALDGVLVARVGASAAGDLLGLLLTEQGARVVSVPPQEAAGSVLLDAADVVVSEHDPDLPEQAWAALGRLRERRPEVVRCSLVGLAPDAPFEWNGLDGRAVAAVLGLHRMSGTPVRPDPLPVAAYYGALTAAVHITAGLLRRDRDGRGTDITVPLASAALTVLCRDLVDADDHRLVDIGPLPHLPNVDLYRCQDGRYLQPHGLYENFVRILCRVMGHEEWIEEAVPALHQLPDRAAVSEWRERFAAVFLQRPALEWEREINAAGGVCTMVRTPAEWAAEAHPHDARILTGADQGPATAGPAVRVIPHPVGPGHLDEGAARASATEPVPPSALPLAGVRVIDFCIVLAGPTCGRILAELGADVVKVDDPVRHVSPFPWLDVNRGKRSIVIDLRRSEGAAVARALVAGADVVVQNFRAGKIDELGFGMETVTAHRPDLVYASLNAFDFDGTWQHRPGWEHNAQAATGMQVMRERDGVPRQVPYPVNDYATGLLGAFGVLLALRHRGRTGVGSWVRASLARSATWIQHAPQGGGAPAFRHLPCADGGVWAAPADAGTPAEPPASLTEAVTAATGREALALLKAAGYAAVREAGPRDAEVRRWLFRTRQLTRWHHPRLGWLEQATPRPHGGDLHRDDVWPAPQPGADGTAILTELGLSPERIDALYEQRAVHPERSFIAQSAAHR